MATLICTECGAAQYHGNIHDSERNSFKCLDCIMSEDNDE